jgi:long-chain acyl-CoA synthetase
LIVFTSGTTGEPKGIAYTHRQTCGAVASILRAFPDIEPGSRLACWLPLANLFQRMINLCAIGRSAQTFYVEDPKSVMQHVPRIAPHLFIGVPRFYEKLYAGIQSAIDAGPDWRRRLADWAISAGDRDARARRGSARLGAGGRIAAAVAERLVLRPLRRRIMGGNLRFFISGSAPMPVWLLERFHAFGFPILEAYGLSESIVPVAANRPENFRFGTVGLPLASTEVRLADDGELLLRGPGVFRAYLGDAVERVDADGFLASGDYATIDGDGFITLTGRKSDLFKTSTGRRIAPAGIEGQLRRIPYVEHAIVFGANRPVVVALLVVSAEALGTRLDGRSMIQETTGCAAAVREDIAAAVTELASWQRPAGIVLITHPLSIDDGFLTPNLKLRRSRIEQAFAGHLDALYEMLAAAPQAPVAQVRNGGDVMLLST